MSTTTATPIETRTAVARMVTFLETGVAPSGLFTTDAFADLSLPHWRIQAENADELVDARRSNHPFPGRVTVTRVDPIAHGFVLEFEERWEDQGQQWYCREMLRADLAGDAISEMSVYCTGDWDEAKQREHAAAVHLARP